MTSTRIVQTGTATATTSGMPEGDTVFRAARALHRALADLRVRVVELDDSLLGNVNTPADLSRRR